jgi:sugar transferase (PEP-CTERM/EpsH1 system associated)
MTKILYLPHRIPFPPNKGDKVRSFNFLKHLAKKHEVYLGTFIDDDVDHQYVKELDAYCEKSFVVTQRKILGRALSTRGFLTGESLSVPYYASRKLQAWVDETIAKNKIDKLLIYSSTMSQFIDHQQYEKSKRVADFCDIDSDKWLQYARKAKWPISSVFNREGSALLAYERKIAQSFDKTIFVTEEESNQFKRLAPESVAKIDHVDNGVDTQYFDPHANDMIAVPMANQSLVFTGAMDYRANVDAVVWFTKDVWPIIRQKNPNAEFFIVGSNPTPEVHKLAQTQGVKVTGRVADVRPYLHGAKVAVAPLRIARGTQNKVLEAMAMAKPTVVSKNAAEGLSSPAKQRLIIEDDPAKMAAEICHLLQGSGVDQKCRDAVIEHYSWESHLSKLDRALELN